MRKPLLALTIAILAVAGAVMAVAGVTAPKSDATSSLCHSTKLTIKAPTSVKARKSVTVSGAEVQKPAHTVKATLQYKKATASAWKNGASQNLSSGAYSLKWKAPSAKGKYKLRVRVTHNSASNTSATRTITVK
jgi:methionine-rich copper-binding protein CopC